MILLQQKGCGFMANISPVSDLRNYNTVLEKVSVGSPDYLTVNGRGKYTIRERDISILVSIIKIRL